MDICRERRSGSGTEKLYMATLFVVPTHSPAMAICEGIGAAVAQENALQYSDDIGCNSHSFLFYGYL